MKQELKQLEQFLQEGLITQEEFNLYEEGINIINDIKNLGD